MPSLTTDRESSHAPPTAVYTTSPVIIAFTLGILICFVLSFCFIYLCRCCFMSALYNWAFQRSASAGDAVRHLNSPTAAANADADNAAATSPYRGLEESLLQIFPTFPYSSVKEFHGKSKGYSLECAICLLEFEEESFLRLLTVCCHVFHQECIDLWLGNHKTCPVCRTNLDDSNTEKNQQQSHNDEDHQVISIEEESSILPPPENNNDDDNNISTIISGDGGNNNNDNNNSSSSNSNSDIRIDVKEEGGEEEEEEKKFSRSHSTGHSIVVIRENNRGENKKNDDVKYTLELPEHIWVKLVRGHSSARSCGTYKEMATHRSRCSYAEAISGC